jgi:ubiquinone/menaquinone biosynthesis C-methylase UbiE
VTALDVIEHIDEDERALRELVRVTKRGGHLLIAVPAFPELWSEHDEVNQHVRRYRARALRDLVTRSGCSIRRFSYMNTALFPLAVGARAVQQIRRRLLGATSGAPKSDLVAYPAAINGLLTAIFAAESPFVRTIGLPCGLSIVCLARKEGG